MPMADDNDAVFKERIYLDKSNPNILHDEITTTDNSLTRPWTVTKNYRREQNVTWEENNCVEGNASRGNSLRFLARAAPHKPYEFSRRVGPDRPPAR
jgi:hypothetical protein